MEYSEIPHSTNKTPGFTKRKKISVSSQQLVKVERLTPESPIPLVIQPHVDDLSLIDWAVNNREFIDAELLNGGALLFRGFHVPAIEQFEQFIASLYGSLLEYSYASTPRSQVTGKIYTSTEYPKDQDIPLHNEMSYSRAWPMRIGFFCVQAAPQGGETPLADSRKVYAHLTPSIRERFLQKKVMYVRNYGENIDLPWQAVFRTTDKNTVEEYCRAANIMFEWKSENHLRTRQVCQGTAIHPQSGVPIWFNQAHLFHISSLKPEVRASLQELFQEEDQPRNAYYGDGSAIEQDILDEISAVYQQERITFPWQERDILLLDNMLTAHGRAPYKGPRKVVVGMAQPSLNEESER